MSEVKIVMLRTGQFLIGKYEELRRDDLYPYEISMEDPLEIMVNPVADEHGNVVPQVGMFPFCLMSKERKFTFKWEDIMTGPQEPDLQCATHYMKSVSKIAIPTPQETSIITG